MKLSIMRHGIAEDEAESHLDADRALTAEGRRRVAAIATALCDEHEEPGSVVTSPLVRAVQTAEIAAVITGLSNKGGGGVDVSRDLSPGGDTLKVVYRLLDAGRSRVLLVGHEPDLSSLVALLVGSFQQHFDKGMVVGLKLPGDGAPIGASRVRFVVEPKSARLTRWDP